MAKLSTIALATEKVKGIEVDYFGVTLIIASSSGRDFQKAISKLLEPHTKRMRRGGLSADRLREIQRPAVAEHVLVGWKNLEDEAGLAITYSKEKAFELLSDERFADLEAFVLSTAGDIAQFMAENEEDAKGN